MMLMLGAVKDVCPSYHPPLDALSQAMILAMCVKMKLSDENVRKYNMKKWSLSKNIGEHL